MKQIYEGMIELSPEDLEEYHKNIKENSKTLYTFNKDEVEILNSWGNVYVENMKDKLNEDMNNLLNKIRSILQGTWNEFMQDTNIK